MSKPGKIHHDRGIATEITSAVAHRYLCRPLDVLPPDRVTQDESAVTCGSCLRLLAEARAKAPAPAVDPEVFDPHLPYEGPGQSELDVTSSLIVNRSRSGEDAPEPRGFSSGWAVLRAWFDVRALSKVRSGWMGEGAEEISDRAMIERQARVGWIEDALIDACADGYGDSGADEVLAIVEWSLAGKSDEDIVGRLMSQGVVKTERQIVRRRRAIEQRVFAVARERGLARAPRERQSEGEEDATQGGTMALPPGFDIEGLKDISAHCGLSISTLSRAKRDADPPPLHDYFGRVVARKSELDAWRMRQVRPRSSVA